MEERDLVLILKAFYRLYNKFLKIGIIVLPTRRLITIVTSEATTTIGMDTYQLSRLYDAFWPTDFWQSILTVSSLWLKDWWLDWIT